MMRTSVGLLALLAFLPAAAGQSLSLEGTTESDDAPIDVHVDGLPDAPTVDVPLGGVAPAREEVAAQGRPDGGDGPEQAQTKETRFAPFSPEAQRAATVAGAGAGLALVLGLVAHLLGIPLFSRIQSSHLLDNEVRQRIHETVVANPGITIKEVTGVCAVGWGTAVYHLKRLEAERLIVSERNRQFRRYFKNGGGIVNESKGAFGELKNGVTERLAQSILAAPGQCQKDLCAAVGISAPLAHKFLSRLSDAGLVSTQREWKTVKYFPTPKLEELLQLTKGLPASPVLAASSLAAVAAS